MKLLDDAQTAGSFVSVSTNQSLWTQALHNLVRLNSRAVQGKDVPNETQKHHNPSYQTFRAAMSSGRHDCSGYSVSRFSNGYSCERTHAGWNHQVTAEMVNSRDSTLIECAEYLRVSSSPKTLVVFSFVPSSASSD